MILGAVAVHTITTVQLSTGPYERILIISVNKAHNYLFSHLRGHKTNLFFCKQLYVYCRQIVVLSDNGDKIKALSPNFVIHKQKCGISLKRKSRYSFKKGK